MSMGLRPLACPNCGHLLHFEARTCSACARPIAFDARTGDLLAMDPARGGWFTADGQEVRGGSCENSRLGACNWFVAEGETEGGLCLPCRHNRIIPDMTAAGVLQRWRRIEDAKRRMFWGLMRLGLPLEAEPDGTPGLTFEFLYDPDAEAGFAPSYSTGYQNGRITLNVIEADDAARERMRQIAGEPYRTLVGHFRHEVGHHYWHALVADSPRIEAFRRLFGDERADYGAAFAAYYQSPPQTGWETDHVSTYATMHPWEDFAETFAHYLHIVDTLADIGRFGMGVGPDLRAGRDERLEIDFDPYTADTATLARAWAGFAFALNAINRSMGQPDLYPFSLNPLVVLKLDFVNRLIAEAAGRGPMGEGEQEGLDAMIAVLGLPASLGARHD